MKNYLKYFFLVLTLVLVTTNFYAQTIPGTTSGTATYCSTTNSGFVSLSGHNGNILFWQLSTDGGATWINIGNTNPNQTYFNLNQTTCYRAVVQNGTFPVDTSTFVCINIFPPTIAGTLSGGGVFCGTNASGVLTLTGTVGNILNWEYSINNGVTWFPIANTTNTENINSVTQTTLFRVIVQSGGCPNDTSNIDTVVVTPQTVAGTVSGPNTVCSGNNSGTLTLAGHTGTIIDWIFSINSGATWNSLSNTTTSYSFNNIAQTTWYKAIIQSGTCNLDSTATKIITVDPPSVAGTLTGGGTFCGSNASGTLTLTGNTGNIVNWEYSINNGVTWLPITNTTNTETYTSLTQTTLYRVNVQSGACPIVTSNIDTVTVVPETVPGTVSSDTAVCYGNNQFNLILNGNVGNVLFWQISTDNGVTWSNISNTTNTLPLSGLTQGAMYRVMVQNGNCSIDSSNNVTITVLPLPTVFAGNDTLIYLGESVTLNGAGTGTPSWTPPTTLNNPSIFNPIATPTNTTNYFLTVTDGNGCTNSDTVIVTVEDTSTINTSVIITNLFTPNGDGINDFWHIKNIENNPNNEVVVYNNYGQVVFSKKNYTNDWGGTSNGSSLPDGTYYYIVKIDDTTEPQKGMLDILR